jgi:hypothetical protein
MKSRGPRSPGEALFARWPPERIVLAAAAVAVLITIVSVRELHSLVDADDTEYRDVRSLHTDLKTVAERALVHAEHLPQLQMQHHTGGSAICCEHGPQRHRSLMQCASTLFPPRTAGASASAAAGGTAGDAQARVMTLPKPMDAAPVPVAGSCNMMPFSE